MVSAGFVIETGATILKHISQNKAASENEKAANTAASLQLMQLGQRNQQETQAAQGNILALDRQARQQQALASVSAGEAGVSGASVDAVIAMSERDAATGRVTIGKNLQMTQEQVGMEGQAVLAQRRARIKQVPKANWAETGLEIAGNAAGAAGSYFGKTP